MNDQICPKCGKPRKQQDGSWAPDWKYMKRQVAIDDLKKEQGKRDEVGDLRLVEFVMKYKPGDQIWWYDSFGFMGPLSGAQGYVLVRNGRAITMLTTAVS